QGSIIPADLRIISSKNLEVNESSLTGESKTVFKIAEKLVSVPISISKISNMAFMGTSVDNGMAKGVVVGIGKDTQFGGIAKSALFVKPTTDFEKGLSKFGRLLVQVILILTIGIFSINTLLGHKLLESLLFSLAIAVGLTPELLPVIVTVSLSHGAGKLAKKKVIAKQLIAIENLGNMDILCTDKTGTLTEGNIELIDSFDANGKKDKSVLIPALLCNTAMVHNKIIGSGIDAAIWKDAEKNKLYPHAEINKVDEEPFDFDKKAMYEVVEEKGKRTLIVKGAPANVLEWCSDQAQKKKLNELFEQVNQGGMRAVVIAQKHISKKDSYSWKDVDNLTYVGYLTFLDIPKISAKEAMNKLERLNVHVKVVTGDNEVVTQKVFKEIGLEVEGVLLGTDIDKFSDAELAEKAQQANIFARVTPAQKLRVIQTLRSVGHTVGYLGDGINDIPALRSADVGISVNTAVDVAKDAASIVLLRKSLDVLAEGIMEGRKTFANTIKYILMGTSSNFGNMFSAAGASFLLPFLPMTPVQILLTNGLYDLSQLSIPSDNVDHESLLKPRHWNINFIRNYMIFFGPISSLYDFLTFGVMIYIFHAQGALFQTGWFIESMATEILVVFVIRTSRTPFFLSKPSKWLFGTCVGIVGISLLIPFSPLRHALGFMSPPPLYFMILIVLVTTYLVLVETLKKIFLKKYSL
ncbi:MAG: magnesium-translocating P-type ATPase, partial [Patescibacteria group bacterium]|nr:magnesium-translocating P-type ATPase [Patescibacteria group bacterium]